MELLKSIDVEIDKGADGEVRRARIRFGPHHAVEVWKDGTQTSFALVATHHGFKADASDVPSQLEQIIGEVRDAHPELSVD